MSMYGAMFGMNPIADVLLATLGLKRGDVGRFRDAFVSEGEIAVYTRNGGGNREHWAEDEKTEADADCGCPGCIITHRLPRHACYLRDEDDDFDCTYATVYFRFPEEFAEDLRKLDAGVKFDPDERWQKLLAALGAL